MAQIGLHCYVSGRVQGVFYRDSTRKKAIELNVTGWVRNLVDGRVEVMICGEENNVRALEQWLWQGPPRARVDQVTSQNGSAETFKDFRIIQ